jgi:Putative beta-barrel porin 2
MQNVRSLEDAFQTGDVIWRQKRVNMNNTIRTVSGIAWLIFLFAIAAPDRAQSAAGPAPSAASALTQTNAAPLEAAIPAKAGRLVASPDASPKKPEFRTIVSVTLSEWFDSNVFLQDVTSQAHRQSMVTAVAPFFGLEWNPQPEFHLAANYSPNVVRYASDPTEDHTDHRGNLNFGGQFGDATYEVLNSATWIDGSRQGVTYTGPGGAPAIGGIDVRDRRQALNLKQSFKLQYPIGDWFLRPVGGWYMNDYKTAYSSAPGYENYASRDDINGGVDIGYKVYEKTYAVVGYRAGHQDQAALPGSPLEYSNDYNRFVFGGEGSPLPWLKFALLAGPEIHYYGPNTTAGFYNNQSQLYVDFSATVTVGKADSVVLSAKRYTRPGYTGRSMLTECLCDALWKHKFTEALSANLGFTAYLADYFPTCRDDDIYTPAVGLAYQFNKHFSAELRYSYDVANSEVPNTDAREFQRQIAMLSLRYTF